MCHSLIIKEVELDVNCILGDASGNNESGPSLFIFICMPERLLKFFKQPGNY